MTSSNNQYRDVWQDDFVLLMDYFSDTNRNPPPAVGITPKELIYSENKLRLFRYTPLGIKQKKTPILITYALVNRPFIIDLEPKRSLVLRLLEHGYPVYLIDWGYPDSSDCFTGLNDYINGYLHRCVQHVKRNSKKKKIDLLGICQGGVFSLCYNALYPADIRKLVTLVTPVDFHADDNLLKGWATGINPDVLTQQTGNIPNLLINQLFKTLKPYQLSRDKYRQLKYLVSKKESLETFLRMEQWLNNGPDLAGQAANEFLDDFYQNNRLHRNTLMINNKSVRLENIKNPVLNILATRDHIVPPDAAKALRQHIKPALYQELSLDGGHIGAFTSLKTQQKLINGLVEWLG